MQMLSDLTDRILGDLTSLRYIAGWTFHLAPEPEESTLLYKLPGKLTKMGLPPVTDPAAVLKTHLSHTTCPSFASDDPKAPWRSDIVKRCTADNDLDFFYEHGMDEIAEALTADGAVAGFLCYPLGGLMDDGSGQKLIQFQAKLNEALSSDRASQSIALIGTACGLYYGYLDFIAWDIDEACKIFKKFFDDTVIPWVSFHTFSLDAGTIVLKQPDLSCMKDYVPPGTC